MEILAFVLLGLAAGAVLPVQAGVNAAMREHLGRPEWATFVNFAVGSVALAGWLLLQQEPVPTLAQATRAPWWSWTGGLLGAFYVTVVILLTPRLGVATTLALAIAGQLVAALALDHYGLLGLAVRAVSPTKLVGAALLMAGVFFIRR
ncbi:MAG TPA: DMT family transporter [Anaeromyxobacteraceae bacterium]|nr:DMT family transporter [Anaeromyxobacteraceae bacterium]